MSEDMELVIAFLDASETFVNGFEAGGVWRQISHEGGDVIDHGLGEGLPLHTANVELFKRMAAARGYSLETRLTEYEEWTAARFTRRARPALRLVGDPL